MSQIENLEEKIYYLEIEKEDIEDLYGDPTTYSDRSLVKTLNFRREELDNLLDHEYNQLQILEEEYLLLTD